MATLQGRASACCFIALLGFLILPYFASATQYSVGDSAGWKTGYNYTQWSQMHTFSVGDSLYFQYAQGTHNLLQVSKADYQSCTTSNALYTDDNANAVFDLKMPGKYWFICGYPSHCSLGMKLVVNVLPTGQLTASPSPAPGAPASTSNAASLHTGALIVVATIIASLMLVFL